MHKRMLIDFKTLVDKYNMNIKRILHVGAHLCEERNAYNACGIKDTHIYWIEGNEDIVRTVKSSNPSINMYQGIVSDRDNQDVDFIITNNGQSSSILELDEHKKEHPHIVEIIRQRRKTCRLDTLMDEQSIPPSDFLNIDIQGAELLALKGMGVYLNHVKYIYTEVNTKHLYKNCALLDEMDSFLSCHGFVRKETSMTPHGWGDALYIREPHPSDRILIIDFYPNTCGGIGDRLVGFVSAIMLSNISHRKLLINFKEPPVTEHIWTVSSPYSVYDQKLDNVPCTVLDSIDKRFKYKTELSTMNLNTWWDSKIVRLRVNQEIASFVYDNPNYPELVGKFEHDLKTTYSNLFTKYLIPRKTVLFEKNPFMNPKKLIGLQIRCGDLSMGCGHVQYISSETLRNSIIPMLHQMITQRWRCSDYSIFITTDSNDCYQLIAEQFRGYNIFKNQGPIDHFEKQGKESGTEKTVRDLMVLSNADILIISTQSNFGRVAALMNKTDEIYSFDFNGKWNDRVCDKTRLSTKHQTSMDSLDI
jgi:FkbM family methyltransferase